MLGIVGERPKRACTDYLWLPDKVSHMIFRCMATHTTRPCIGVNRTTHWYTNRRYRCVAQQLIAYTCMLVKSRSHILSTRKVLGSLTFHIGDKQLVLATTTLSSYAACLTAYSDLKMDVDNSYTNIHLIPLILWCISMKFTCSSKCCLTSVCISFAASWLCLLLMGAAPCYL